MAKMKWERILTENDFPGVEIPEFSWLKVKLEHFTTINNKENTEKHDFSIVVDISEKLKSEDKNMSKKIQEILKLDFSPYYWREKSYKYYTNDYTGALEHKQQILKNLLSFLKEYELTKEFQMQNSNVLFEEDKKTRKSYDIPEMAMKYSEELDRFIVVAKGFMGSELYRLFRSSAEYSSQLIEIMPKENQNKYLLTTDFFSDLVSSNVNKKTYFVIQPEAYEKIKQHFENELIKEKEFINEQKQISSTLNLSDLNVTEENVFDFKIEFIPENQCFSFYSKGYLESPVYNGIRAKRSLLGIWGLNFIYSKEAKEGDELVFERELIVENKTKISLNQLKGSSKKEKDIRIPASDWEKIKELKENYEKEIVFWKRPQKSIKITHCDFTRYGIFESYPAIYIDNKGNTFFTYASRRTGNFQSVAQKALEQKNIVFQEETKKERSFSQTMKAIPISFQETKYFLEEHPFAKDIKAGSLLLNHVIHSPENNLSVESQKKTFEKIFLMAEINDQSKLNKDVEKPKKKTIKI